MQIASSLLFLGLIALLLAIYLLAETRPSDQEDLDAKKRRLRNLYSVQMGLLILLVSGFFLLMVLINRAATLPAATIAAWWKNLATPTGLPWLLGAVVYFALVGIFPLTYLAYRQVVSPSQKKRLAEDFMLLGYRDRDNAEREASEQYDMAYSPKQYVWYILLIILVSGLVLFGYALPGKTMIGSIDHNILALMLYAYLGAFVFSIQELIRRFNTEDLRPQVYSSILVRMLVAVTVVFVGAQILMATGAAIKTEGTNGIPAEPAAWAAILAFLIGVFPKSGIEWFQKLAKTTLSTPEEVNVLPVRNIQGISTWHEARLIEMGVDDVQNLATVHIPRILLNTRFDTQEVINWIDQAILYAKVGKNYPRFKEAAITTFHEFRIRYDQAKKSGRTAEDLKNLAVRLGLTVPEDLDYLADPTPYSNYAYITQYYTNTAELAQTRAQAGRDDLGGYLIGAEEEERREFTALRDKYQARLVQNPNDPASWANLGLVQFKLGLSDEAYTSLKRAVELNPNLAEALANLSQICVMSRKWEEARLYATRAIDINPYNKDPYRHRGIALIELKELESAIEDFNQAINLDDHFGEAYYRRGIAYNLLAQYENSVADFDIAYWLLNDRSDPKFWLEWGTAYLGLANQKEKNNHGSGRADYQTSIEKLSESIARQETAEANWKRGLACYALDWLENAVRDYLRAIVIAERFGGVEIYNIYFLLGDTYRKAGRLADACAAYQKIVDNTQASSDLAIRAAKSLTTLGCGESPQAGGAPPSSPAAGDQTAETAATPGAPPTANEETPAQPVPLTSAASFGELMTAALKQLSIEVKWNERLEIYARAVLGQGGVSLPENKLQELAASTGITSEMIQRADLMRLQGINAPMSALLVTAGVTSIEELSEQEAAPLLDKLHQANGNLAAPESLPGVEVIQDWIVQAQQLTLK